MGTLKSIIMTGILISFIFIVTKVIASDYLSDAQKYYDKGEYKSAIIQLKNRLKENPEDVTARFLLAKSQFQIGEIIQADKEIARAYQLNPSNEEYRITYAQLLLLQRKYEKVEEILKNQFNDSKNEIKRQIYKAYAALGQNKLVEAKQMFTNIANDSDEIQVFNGLAKIAILENEMNVAYQWVEKALTLEPLNSAALEIKANLEYINKNYHAVLNIYNGLINKNKNNLLLYLKRADVKIQLKDFPGAKNDAQKVLDKIKLNPQANFLMAKIHLQQREYEEAQKAAQNVLNVLPNHLNSMLMLGMANYGLGNFNQAEKYLSQYLFANTDNLFAQNVLANVYIAQNKAEQSILILEGLDEERKNYNVAILMTLSSAYFLTGEYHKGIDILNKAKKLEPNNYEIQKKLIQGMFKLGNTEGVINNLEKMADSEGFNDKSNYLLIVLYIQNNKLQKAENKLKTLIKKTPKNPALYNLLGLIKFKKGNHSEASETYRHAIRLDNNYIPAYLGLAEIATLKQDLASAKTYFTKILEINPKYTKAHIYLSVIAEKEENQEEVEKQLKIALEKSRGDIKSQLTIANLLSKLYLKQKKPEKILDIAQKFIKNYPENKSVLSFLSSAQIVNDQLDKAEQTLKKIIYNDTTDVKNRLMLVSLLSKRNENETEIFDLIDSLIKIMPENPKPVLLKATFLLKNKEYEQVLEVASYAKKQFPKLALGDYIEGNMYRMQKNLDQALISYQKAYKKQPGNELLFLISSILKNQGKKDEALKKLEEGLKNNDQDLGIHFKIASIYQNNQQNDMAVKHYLKMLEIDTNNLQALNNIAWLYTKEKNPQALIYAQKAYEKAPNSAAIIDTYGYILIKNGNFNEGIKLLREAIALAPEAYDIQYHLAEGYYLNGDNKKAKVLLNTLLSKKAEFSEKENAKNLYTRLK